MSNQDERLLLSKPGDTIMETIDCMGLGTEQLAMMVGVSHEEMLAVIDGDEPIDSDMAAHLERVLHIDAQFWLNYEALYREKLRCKT